MYNPLLVVLANSDIFPAHAGGLKGLLISFLVALIVLFIVIGLLWVIEAYVYKQALPNPVRLVIALILVVCVMIWAITNFL